MRYIVNGKEYTFYTIQIPEWRLHELLLAEDKNYERYY